MIFFSLAVLFYLFMQDSKLIQLLRWFSKEKQESLRQFLSWKMLGASDNVTLLYDFVLGFAPRFEDPKMTKENAFAYCFPKANYRELRIKQLMSELVKKMEQFIAVSGTFQDNSTQQFANNLSLLDFYMRRSMTKEANYQLKVLEKLQDGAAIRDGRFYHDQFLLEIKKTQQLAGMTQRKGDLNLQAVINNLDLYYIVNQLEIACFAYAHQEAVQVEYTFPMLESVISYVQGSDYAEVPVIQLYMEALTLLKGEGDKESLEKFSNLLDENIDSFSPNDARSLFTYVLNFCTKKAQVGEEDYYQYAFELYKRCLKNGVILVQGKLIQSDFTSIVKYGLQLKEFDFVRHFIESYKEQIHGDAGKDVCNDSYASLLFQEKAYDDAIEFLNSIQQYHDVFYDMNARRLLIKIYYEQEEFDLCTSKLNAFKRFLYYNKTISKQYQRSNLNFVLLMHKVLNLAPSQDKKRMKLAQKAKENDQLSERKWVLEKLEELV